MEFERKASDDEVDGVEGSRLLHTLVFPESLGTDYLQATKDGNLVAYYERQYGSENISVDQGNAPNEVQIRGCDEQKPTTATS